MEHPEQARLAQRAGRGDKQAFADLYDFYVQPIYRFIFYKTHQRETAEDLTSQTFAKALEKIRLFQAGKGTFSGWLYRIARNTVIDYYRTLKSSVNIEDAWGLTDEADIAADLENREKLQEVSRHLKQLSAEQREIVILRVWQELSYAEIASILDKSEDSCKMLFSRTIRKLRETVPLAAVVTFFALYRYL